MPTLCHQKHSSLTLETANRYFVFDWYDKTEPDFPPNKKVVFIASHSHGDHFHPAVLGMGEHDTLFILSDDIEIPEDCDRKITLVRPDEVYEIEDFTITTFGSTDLGVSLLLSVDDLSFFFAGDLNAWIWENDDEETQQMEKSDYLIELDKIKKHAMNIACVPADPRLGPNYDEGVRLFFEKCKPKKLVPIHFQTDYTIPKKLARQYPTLPIVVFSKAGECREIDN